MALTWTRRTSCPPPARSTTTPLPVDGRSSDAQLVASSSSISRAMLTPSPVAVAPAAAEARLVGMVTARATLCPAVTVTGPILTSPRPGARATNS